MDRTARIKRWISSPATAPNGSLARTFTRSSGSWQDVTMEPVNVVTLVGLIGSAIGYLLSRIDQRSTRARLKNDMKLLELAPAGSPARRSLEALVDREAERLNRPWAVARYQMLPQGLWILGAGVLLYVVAYGVRYSALSYFNNFLAEYVSYSGGGGYQLNNAGTWVVATTYSLETLGAVVALVGLGIVIVAFIARLTPRLRSLLTLNRNPSDPGVSERA
jgi:uncharacterized membrane-anchored protein YhcB (DUF1043 family)